MLLYKKCQHESYTLNFIMKVLVKKLLDKYEKRNSSLNKVPGIFVKYSVSKVCISIIKWRFYKYENSECSHKSNHQSYARASKRRPSFLPRPLSRHTPSHFYFFSTNLSPTIYLSHLPLSLSISRLT